MALRHRRQAWSLRTRAGWSGGRSRPSRACVEVRTGSRSGWPMRRWANSDRLTFAHHDLVQPLALVIIQPSCPNRLCHPCPHPHQPSRRVQTAEANCRTTNKGLSRDATPRPDAATAHLCSQRGRISVRSRSPCAARQYDVASSGARPCRGTPARSGRPRLANGTRRVGKTGKNPGAGQPPTILPLQQLARQHSYRWPTMQCRTVPSGCCTRRAIRLKRQPADRSSHHTATRLQPSASWTA